MSRFRMQLRLRLPANAISEPYNSAIDPTIRGLCRGACNIEAVLFSQPMATEWDLEHVRRTWNFGDFVPLGYIDECCGQ